LFDDIDVQASGQINLDAAGSIAVSGHGDLQIDAARAGEDIYLHSNASLIDSSDLSYNLAAVGDVRLESVGNIAGASGNPFVIHMPNGSLRVDAGGDVDILQSGATVLIEGTDYTATEMRVDQAHSTGPMRLETEVGDLRIGQVTSEDTIELQAPESILDDLPADHPSVANVATSQDLDAFGGNVTLIAAGGVIGGARQFMVSLPSGELTAGSAELMQVTSLDDLHVATLQTLDGNVVLRVDGDLAIGQIAGGNDVVVATSGDVTDANAFAYFDILGNDIWISSLDGGIGEPGNDIELESVAIGGTPGFTRLSARESIFATETFGALRVERAISELGDIRLSVTDSAATGSDLIVPASAKVEAFNGSATFNSGDNVTLSGSIAADRIFIRGDHRSQDTDGAVITLFNDLNADYVEIETGDNDDFVTLTSVSNDVTVKLNGGDDAIKSGSGDDIIDGGAGVDLIEGNAGNDRLTAGSGIGDWLLGGPGDDVLIGSDDGADSDPDFTDSVRFGDLLDGGPGNNRIAGLGGADTILGGNDEDHVDSGSGKDYVLTFGGDDWIYQGIDGDEFVDGGSGSNTIISGGTDPALAQPTLPSGPVDAGRWRELRGSASGFGVSGPGVADAIAFADSPSVIATADGTIAAWTDTRSGREQVYVARFDGTEWLPLGKDEFGGGVSDPSANSTKPSLMVDSAGHLFVAWEQRSENGTDVLVTQYDEGSNAWIAVGDSLGETGVSQTKFATSPQLISHSTGPVLAWTDTSSGEAQIYVKYFDGSDWAALGVSESGEPSDVNDGITLADPDADVRDMQIVTDGQQIAIVWSQVDSGNRHIYLREFSGGVWQEIYSSASFGGLSANFTPNAERFHNQSPTVAFVRNELLVAWQSFSDGGGNVRSIAYQKDAGVWGPPTPIDSFATSDHDAQPRLVSNNFDARLIWANDERSIYARRYDAGEWLESVAGDASGLGIQSGSIRIDSIVAASDPDGFATVAWIDSANDRSSFHLLVEEVPQVLPRVIGSTINGDGNPNRSGIATLAVQFSQPVTQSAFGGLRLRNHSDGTFIDLVGVLPAGNGTDLLTWDLLPYQSQITDGRYTAELLSADFALVNGENLQSSSVVEFHKRAGDLNGDTRVNFADFGGVGANFDPLLGEPFRAGDGNGDGRVNFADFGVVGGNFDPLALPASQMDFGDALEAGTNYPTTLANDGARHLLGSQTYLGSAVDAESDGLPSSGADTDGADDGITATQLLRGQSTIIDVTVTTPGEAFLNAWFDWNADGDWDDPGEQVWQDVAVGNGVNSLELFVPSTAVLGNVTSRLRLSESAGYGYAGLAATGEVEDYQVEIIHIGSSRSLAGGRDKWAGVDLSDIETLRKKNRGNR
jgi:Ca2+-binding RTX toxin-like protein